MTALTALRLAERSALVAIFLTMVGLFALNVAARQWGGDLATDLAWIDEAVRILNLFLVFLAAGLALERGRHVSVHTWRDRLAARTRLPLRRVIDALGLVFSLYVAWLGLKMTLFVFATGQRSPTLGLAMGWIYVAPTAGFALLALRYGLNLAGVTDRYATQAAAEASAEEAA
ncbi:TRAP transporter small permease (plasmid) [Paroceanicella profunda]|uniref:TRAP transporter small permease protein n=1 Tax=Paroceanicella profunda TaxID=2579971 RepID=A0A5B8FJP4_9RHOB|nr:TRAP transporter small permease subunit [Paroceanicella profunda]QDL94558.1 TRAP transporter small permease [Paroceanicella profunda]